MIEIKDNNEKLFEVDKVCPGIILKLKNNQKAYLRKTVAEMLCKAKNNLPEGYTFIIYSAWRSKSHQKRTYWRIYKKFKNENPKWSDDKIKKVIHDFIDPYEGDYVSGHMTGAAVDLGLAKNNHTVPLTSQKLPFAEKLVSKSNNLPIYIQENRKIMYKALEKSDLVNYDKEYWHWSYGDYLWAEKIGQKTAIYGPTERME